MSSRKKTTSPINKPSKKRNASNPFSNVVLLLVDMDNTLCNTFHTLSKPQWERVATLLDVHGRTNDAKHMRKCFGSYSFMHALEGLSLTNLERRLLIKEYDSVPVKTLKLYDDAQAILDLPLKKVLVSRGEKKFQNEKIKHLKIAKYFDEIHIVPTFEDKEVAFKRILDAHKLKANQALVIGDRIEEEILDANKLGIPSVLVRRPDWRVNLKLANPTVTVRTLERVPALLGIKKK